MQPDHDDHAADRHALERRRIAELNASLCRTLGITNVSDLAGVKLVLKPGERPTLTVTRRLRLGDVVERFTLEPIGPPARARTPPERPPP